MSRVGMAKPLAQQGGLSAPLLGRMAQFTPRGYFGQTESGIGQWGAARSRPDPVKHGCDVMGLGAWRNRGAVNHQDGNLQLACGDEFGLRPGAAGILAHDQIDPLRLHQGRVGCGVKRAAIDEDVVVWQGGRGLRCIHKTQQVAVLWLRGKGRKMHASKREHDVAPRPCQGARSGRDVARMRPVIACAGCPGRAGQRHQGDARKLCGAYGVGAYGGSEWVGCIHKMGDMMCAQVVGQPFCAAKPAHAHGYGLRFGACDAPGITEGGGQASAGEFAHKACGLKSATKNKDIWHG